VYLTSLLRAAHQGRGVANIFPWSPLPLKLLGAPQGRIGRAGKTCSYGRHARRIYSAIAESMYVVYDTLDLLCRAANEGVSIFMLFIFCGVRGRTGDSFSMTQFPRGDKGGLAGRGAADMAASCHLPPGTGTQREPSQQEHHQLSRIYSTSVCRWPVYISEQW